MNREAVVVGSMAVFESNNALHDYIDLMSMMGSIKNNNVNSVEIWLL